MCRSVRATGRPRSAWTGCAGCEGGRGSPPICFLERYLTRVRCNQIWHWPLTRLKTSIFGGHSLWTQNRYLIFNHICQRFDKDCTACEGESRELFGRSRPPTIGREDQPDTIHANIDRYSNYLYSLIHSQSTNFSFLTLNSSHLNCIDILESITVSLRVHPKVGERLQKRSRRQEKVGGRDGGPCQGGHYSVL